MSHMVIYRGADGKPGYHQTDDIHDAVGFVERMRNEEGVEQARIFRLEEVVFEYRPYYRVQLTSSQTELAAGSGTQALSSGEEEESSELEFDTKILADASETEEEVEDESFVEQEAEVAGASKRGLFGR